MILTGPKNQAGISTLITTSILLIVVVTSIVFSLSETSQTAKGLGRLRDAAHMQVVLEEVATTIFMDRETWRQGNVPPPTGCPPGTMNSAGATEGPPVVVGTQTFLTPKGYPGTNLGLCWNKPSGNAPAGCLGVLDDGFIYCLAQGSAQASLKPERGLDPWTSLLLPLQAQAAGPRGDPSWTILGPVPSISLAATTLNGAPLVDYGKLECGAPNDPKYCLHIEVCSGIPDVAPGFPAPTICNAGTTPFHVWVRFVGDDNGT